MRETLKVEGTGVNLKLGMIVRPADALRIGLSFHTPTYISLTDDYGVEMAHSHNFDPTTFSVMEDEATSAVSSPANTSDYHVISPYRLNLGLMYLLGKRGFLTADLEYLDYGSAKLRSPFLATNPAFYDYQFENENIQNLFQSAINARLGIEIRQDIYRIRLGTAFYGTALDESAHTYEDVNNLGSALSIKPNRRLLL